MTTPPLTLNQLAPKSDSPPTGPRPRSGARLAWRSVRALAASAVAVATMTTVGSLVGAAGASTDPPAPLQALAQCESSGNYAADTGNGYYGAYQFSLATWHRLGFGGLPSQATPATQDHAVLELWQQRGWAPWPACSAQLGLGSYSLSAQAVEAATSPQAAATTSGGSYTVRSGDTLGAIAASHDTTVAALAAKNHLANPNLIRTGQVLLI